MNMDYDFTLLLFIFMRMSGCILFNPILGRKNLPVILKVGLTLMLSFFSYHLVPAQTIHIASFLVLSISLLKELLIGYIVGYIIQLFLSVIMIGGENMDMQIGISMSRIYDPQSNISMPLSASLMNLTFVLIFFAVNGHLTLIQIFTKLSVMIPYDQFELKPEMTQHLVSLFSLILIYAVKLALPVLAAEFIAEIAVGLIMKAVPQIDVFVINIQVKVILGFLVFLIMVPSLSTFLERLITLMFDNISQVFVMLK
ncbi:flagellar biosynthetic protein FliR [Caproiciproducens galactitolivorans]|uniref:flagellar biosynthetic protein FliR n=1 Tax=Caproiciproducens galactitolivorans TaxID=642589 RepID=UPI0024090CF7|nr:flagellar biosynthetic protein FliR [Caproiciproducens galactitolivorans]